jgi:hypothetical protein
MLRWEILTSHEQYLSEAEKYFHPRIFFRGRELGRHDVSRLFEKFFYRLWNL